MTPAAISAVTDGSVSAGLEIERQWRAHARLRLPSAIGAWSVVDCHESRLVDSYYDTSELELHSKRARLRIRRSQGLEISTLKRRVSSDAGLRRRIDIDGPCEGAPETS